MASTFTSSLRLTKQGDGDNPNSWGVVLNDGVISLVDDAIAGYTTVSLGSAATVTLSAVDGGGDVPRSAFSIGRASCRERVCIRGCHCVFTKTILTRS